MKYEIDSPPGKEVVRWMVSRIEWIQSNIYTTGVSKDELSLLNKVYSRDRTAAMKFGVDVSDLPRKLKMTTRLPTLPMGPEYSQRSYAQ